MAYDRDNVFARILRGEIPCQKVHENEHALAFRDIRPLTPQHVLVIPKGEYRNLDELAARGSDAEIAGWVRAIAVVAREVGVVERGYRVLANNGPDAHQEVPHLHMHVFGGRDLGGMIAKKA
jgi:diadenosine tetraphosphate (Ap4A) HIT family hydrolase